MNKLIQCTNLAFSYDGEVVLRNVTFDIREGDYLCIVGENGAGKSTLVSGLLGLKVPSSGKIVYEGLKSSEIGYLPQKTRIQRDFPANVHEVVMSGNLNALGRRLFYGAQHREKAMHHMRSLGIWEMRNEPFRELSGGQQQRVLLARALCATGRLILLDEPAAGLDPLVTNEFYELLNRVNKEMGIAVIMVSHDIHSALRYAGKILHLKQEQIFFGTAEEYEETEVGKAFLGYSCQFAAVAHEHKLHCEVEHD
ncbi:MAG: metal ABC transporter ATP-binding protein [Bacillota bacterium]|nr:metal ABC transporter ATP-binding protein [Bacillota bacterium]